MQLGLACCSGISLYFAADALCSAFSSDNDVAATAARMLRIGAFAHVVDAMQTVASSLLYGVGRPTFPMAVNLAGYYCVGFPIACLLCLKSGVGVEGIFYGHLSGVSFIGVSAVVYMLRRLDWQAACDDAVDRSQQERDKEMQRVRIPRESEGILTPSPVRGNLTDWYNFSSESALLQSPSNSVIAAVLTPSSPSESLVLIE